MGRSGTGKTTCSVLRLFGAEYLAKLNSQRTGFHFTDGESEETGLMKKTNLKSIFVSVSPVLAR